jgi:DNA invertase Pin-like site-specific DNA recombinase
VGSRGPGLDRDGAIGGGLVTHGARFGEGIAAAKQRGVYTGRKPALTPEQAHQVRERAAAGERKSALAREFGISRETIYSYLRATSAAGV